MIIYIKNWGDINQTPALSLRDRSLVAIVRGYIKNQWASQRLGFTSSPSCGTHTRWMWSSRYVTPAISSPWLSPPPGLRSAPGVARPLSGQPWMPCAVLSLLSACSTTNRTELKTHCRKNEQPACFINTGIPATQFRMISTRKPCCSCP